MKYRVRVDFAFEDEADALALMNYAKEQASKAVSIKEGQPDEQISFCELELCRHEEGLPCASVERVEIRRLP